MTQIAPTLAEKTKVLDLMEDFFHAHGLEILNMYEDEDIQGNPKEPEVSIGFAIAIDGHIITTVPAENSLTSWDIADASQELKDTND